ncbi:MAG TPA: hypothetical protein VHX64_12375, partial [Caulobacteraceae bacterium]|nr:hypothetical protein [Caulobacteraceae bacterium]
AMGQVRQAANAGGSMFPALDWKTIVDNGYIVIGNPKRVAEQLHEFADEMNVGHLMLLMHFGDMKKDTVLYNTRRFAEEVIPQVRGRFSGWEDRWWPKGAAAPTPQLQPAQ